MASSEMYGTFYRLPLVYKKRLKIMGLLSYDNLLLKDHALGFHKSVCTCSEKLRSIFKR